MSKKEDLLLTRKSELERLVYWADNKQSAPMMWFYGHIGTGKTTIVTALQDLLEQQVKYISLKPEDSAELLLILRKATENNSKLVILDNFDLCWRHERLLGLRLLSLLNSGLKLLLVGRKPLPRAVYTGPVCMNY